MLNNALTIAVTLRAFDEMTRVVAGATATATRHFKQISETAKAASAAAASFGVGSIATGTAVGVALLKPIQAYSDLEDAVTRAKVAFMMRNGIDKGFVEVQRVAEKLGGMLPGTTQDFTIMASKLKELGISTTAIARGGLEATAYLRVLMGNLAPEAVAELTATFKTSLGIAERDFVRFIDLVQKQKFAFGVDPTDFAYTLKYVGPQLKQLGLVGYDSAAKIMQFTGALSQAGIRGESLGTSLRGVFTALPGLNKKIEESKTLATMLKAAHIQLTFFDRGGRFLGMENLVRQVEKLKALNPQQRLLALNELFGSEAGTAMAEATSLGVAGYRKAGATLQQQADLQTRLNLIMGTLKNQWESFTGNLDNAFSAIGVTAAGDALKLIGALNRGVDAVGAWVKANPALTRQLFLGAAGFAAVSITVGGLALGLAALGNVIAFTTGGFGHLGTASLLLGGKLRDATIAVRTFGVSALALRFPTGVFAAWSAGLTALQARLLVTTTALRGWGLASAGLSVRLASLQLRLALSIAMLRAWAASHLLALRGVFSLSGGLVGLNLRLAATTSTLRVMAASRAAAMFATLAGWLRAAAVAARLFSLSLLGNPLTWVALAVVAAAILIYKYWKPIAGFFRGLWGGIVAGARPALMVLGPMFSAISTALHLDPVFRQLQALWTWFTNLLTPVEDVGGAGEAMGRRLGLAIGTAATQLMQRVTGLVSWLAQIKADFWEAGANLGTAIADGIMSTIERASAAVRNFAANARSYIPFGLGGAGVPAAGAMGVPVMRPAPGPVALPQVRSSLTPGVRGSLSPALNGAARGGGGAVSVSYAPTMHFGGSVGPGEKAAFAQQLQAHKHEVARVVREATGSRNRSSFEGR